MPSIYLLRHCKYDNPRKIIPGRLPVELSDKGQLQARRLGDFFADKKIKRIYSSAVLRCKQTAEIVAQNVIPITFDQRLLETFTAYQGYWQEAREGDAHYYYEHHDELGGEILPDIQQRMMNFWEEVIVSQPQDVLICSHADPIMTLIHHLRDLSLPTGYIRESDLPGWLQKGEFLEVVWKNGVGEIKAAIRL